MTVFEIIKLIENWAPPGIAWESDNVGLQVGSSEAKIKGILISLELTEKVLDEALRRKCNLIITHHPLIFKPLKNLNYKKNPKARLIEKLIKNDINLFCAHTNLDFTKGGVNFKLAEKLKLKNIRFLENQSGKQFKVVVFIPEPFLEKVSSAIFIAGGGIIGNYENCSFRLSGRGTFKGGADSNPVLGSKGTYESVDEVRLEVVVDAWKLSDVLNAALKSHPYEEPAYDIYPLENSNVNYGYGAAGELENSMTTKEFLHYVAENLKIKNFRFSVGKKTNIKKVAVFGGSGIGHVDAAIAQKFDAYITADVKYHEFQDAERKILVVDAGHYETEVPIVEEIYNRLTAYLGNKKDKIKVFKYKGNTNPIKFYNN